MHHLTRARLLYACANLAADAARALHALPLWAPLPAYRAARAVAAPLDSFADAARAQAQRCLDFDALLWARAWRTVAPSVARRIVANVRAMRPRPARVPHGWACVSAMHPD